MCEVCVGGVPLRVCMWPRPCACVPLNVNATALGQRTSHMVGQRASHMVGQRVSHMVGQRASHMVGQRASHMVGQRASHMTWWGV